jgi:hypothetical protein
MKKWCKEPLLHFLVIGALIFVVFSIANKEEAAVSGNKIVVSSVEIERLSYNWSRKWNRPPTETELQGLIESYIKEEVYYREALTLGLDQNDTILRRRLMQKMEFLSNDLAELNQPDETELNEYFVDNQDKYDLPARISFTHIYFSMDRRGAKAFEAFYIGKRYLAGTYRIRLWAAPCADQSKDRCPDAGVCFSR